jgi:tRNA-specific 2-thiouridylase
MRAEVQIRSKHRPAPAAVTALADLRASVRFEVPQRAVTPGQAAVLYEGDVVIGGGWIETERECREADPRARGRR